MATLTFIGGFLDVYTFITRGGVFANTQTTNLARLGYCLGTHQWVESIPFVVSIIACILGGLTSTILIKKGKDEGLHQNLILFEILVLFSIGFIRNQQLHLVVNSVISFITSFQLNMFRKYHHLAHNTTISTGNLRQVGELIGNYFGSKSKTDRDVTLKYTSLVFMFVIGAIFSVFITNVFNEKSIWVCSLILLVLIGVGLKQKVDGYEN